MLATLTERRFSDPGWTFEPKFDGERCLAFRSGGKVRLLSRNRLALNGHYPELAEALGSQDTDDFVVDGEIVAFEEGRTSFARLQRRMQIRDPEKARQSGVAVFLYVFDVLHVNGFDLAGLEQRHRKSVLRRLLSFRDPLRFTAHRNTKGEAYWEEACRKGWEGVIAKRADAPYVHGRSRDWLKFKCVNEQELVIGGYTDPQGSREGFGALLVGHYRDEDLVYAGKVGTGFDDRTLERLVRQLRSIKRSRPSFTAGRLPRTGVHWVEPRLVAQIGFTEWTRDGQLRHPRFLGLREDKDPREVVRERPA
ncbi:MAG: non-homologous end-joining DNA ligase [Actinomycetota bacterium]|nr:non-homologous end-joining DNA ligase [Actinomycetota bacterium]